MSLNKRDVLLKNSCSKKVLYLLSDSDEFCVPDENSYKKRLSIRTFDLPNNNSSALIDPFAESPLITLK